MPKLYRKYSLSKQEHQFVQGKSHYLKDTFEQEQNSEKTDHNRIIMLQLDIPGQTVQVIPASNCTPYSWTK